MNRANTLTATIAELAEITNLSTRRLYQINKEKQILSKIGEGYGAYDLIFFFRAYMEWTNDEGVNADLDKERAEHEALKKQITQLKLETARGNLVDAESVLEQWTDILSVLRAHLLSLPVPMAQKVAIETDINTIAGIVDAEIRKALTTTEESFRLKVERRDTVDGEADSAGSDEVDTAAEEANPV